MAEPSTTSLIRPGDKRWKRINAEQEAEDVARYQAMTVAERLDHGIDLSQFAAELRRSVWQARHGRTAT